MRRSLIRAATTTALAVTVVLYGCVAVGAAAPTASPITPANRPTALANAVNGLVPDGRLVNVANNCRAAREAGPSLARVFAMAREARVPLGADQCYRPLHEQVQYARQAAQPGNNPACVASVGVAPNGAPVGHSYHGWGKAADLVGRGDNSLTFASPGYAFMKQVAGSLGWNHPAFAEPGGSSCPEPWHWEWVGDGGDLGNAHVPADAVGLLPSADERGYAVVDGLGGVSTHGNFVNRGSAASLPITWVVVGAAPTPDRKGYWMVGADGGVFSFGNAGFHGSTGNRALTQPVNGMTPTKTGKGYWLLAWDGGVFTFGDARFYGSTGAYTLNAPVDGMAPTATGKGYWLVASDGGVFTFGDARYLGSLGGIPLPSPVVGLVPSKSGNGYWIELANGAVFGFGDVPS